MQKLLRQKWTWSAGLLVMLSLSAAIPVIWSNARRCIITQKDCDRIQEGMTLEEVQSILGELRHSDIPIFDPPIIVTIEVPGEPPRSSEAQRRVGMMSAWRDKADDLIWVTFDNNGKVESSCFQKGRMSLLERIIKASRDQLGL